MNFKLPVCVHTCFEKIVNKLQHEKLSDYRLSMWSHSFYCEWTIDRFAKYLIMLKDSSDFNHQPTAFLWWLNNVKLFICEQPSEPKNVKTLHHLCLFLQHSWLGSFAKYHSQNKTYHSSNNLFLSRNVKFADFLVLRIKFFRIDIHSSHTVKYFCVVYSNIFKD